MSDIHNSRQKEYLAVTISMTVLSTVFVLLRFLPWKKGTRLSVEDCVVLASLIFFFAEAGLNISCKSFVSILACICVANKRQIVICSGMGLHADTLSTKSLMTIQKISMAYECVYCTTVSLIKISILLIYARIFTIPSRGFRIASIVLGITVAFWTLSLICLQIFQCAPLSRAWNTSIPGMCIDSKGLFIGNGVPNIITDIAILSLPVHAVWKMQAATSHFLSIIAIFVFGILCVQISIFPSHIKKTMLTIPSSSVVFTSVYRFTTMFDLNSADVSWTLGKSYTWGVIECTSGIIIACLPNFHSLLVMISSRSRSKKGHLRMKTTNLQSSTPNTKPAFRPPDELLVKPMVLLRVTQPDEESGDEVPLNTIMVRHSMTWQESNSGPARNSK
ncbi:hypothetical protein N7493_009844 [Penicillium malachiteum]|uniref:Rhodopsin domain-containing protein n=1 Tax=Penicillium malachiteum TaxID=1324776 RepID=A0AAD6MS38_9EURO|nr:hypothetical protein N7493_009844 [Penicillium malachiteum]